MTGKRNALVYACTDQEGEDRIHIAAGVNLEDATLNVVCGSIAIGRGTFCGHRVMLLTGSHKPNGEVADQGRDIIIGEDVWLASGCIVLGPCTIGDRCVVAAGAVVSPRSELEAGWVYAGVPARKLRLAEDEALAAC
jgi:acetyltransferase-like isoleucine patch superfamily enzyme